MWFYIQSAGPSDTTQTTAFRHVMIPGLLLYLYWTKQKLLLLSFFVTHYFMWLKHCSFVSTIVTDYTDLQKNACIFFVFKKLNYLSLHTFNFTTEWIIRLLSNTEAEKSIGVLRVCQRVSRLSGSLSVTLKATIQCLPLWTQYLECGLLGDYLWTLCV